MKHIILLFLITTAMFGASINDSLLKVHATLLPKLALMDYRLGGKVTNNTLSIAILHDENIIGDAESLKSKITSRYQRGVKGYTIDIKLVEYKDMNATKANIYYIFPTTDENLKQTISMANRSKGLTFAYQQIDIQKGVMLSLEVGKKVKPILNVDAIKSGMITFRPILLKISTIYTAGKSNMLLNFEDSHLIKLNKKIS